MTHGVRGAAASETGTLARLWHRGWHEAHARIVPAELVRQRSPAAFEGRTARHLGAMRVLGPPGRPAGLCITRGDELFQLYVAAEARGTGAAALLLADGEAILRARGVGRAWLACAIGNDRAERFYRRHGWRCAEAVVEGLELADGTFPLRVGRFEKDLGGA